MPNQRDKDKKFTGAWLPLDLHQDSAAEAKRNGESVADMIIRGLKSELTKAKRRRAREEAKKGDDDSVLPHRAAESHVGDPRDSEAVG